MQHSEEKLRYLSGSWLKQLWAGRFLFGDTFFAGMFGPAFILLPVGFVVAGFLAVTAPAQMGLAILIMTVVYAVYFSVTLPAVIKTGLKAKHVGGWRWFGIFLALAATGALWWAVFKFFVAL